MSDVARLAGVHKATASRALSAQGSSRLNAATVRRVQAAAKRLGYTPNAAARSLRTNRSFTVGVILPDLTNPLFPPIVRGIEEVLMSQGYTALLASTDNDAERERTQYNALLGRQVDGFIVGTASRQHPLLTQAHTADIPIVLLNRGTDETMFPLVAGDDAAGVTLAVDHLAGLGHRHIAHLAGPPALSTGVVRSRAFRHAVDAHGIDPARSPVLTCAAYSEAAGADACAELLVAHPGTTAIVAGNDLIALGALHTLRDRGLSCPEDVSLVGFNDMRFADELRPPLTTVRVPNVELGAEAARLLLARLGAAEGNAVAGSRPVAKTLLLPLELVVRESTRSPSR